MAEADCVSELVRDQRRELACGDTGGDDDVGVRDGEPRVAVVGVRAVAGADRAGLRTVALIAGPGEGHRVIGIDEGLSSRGRTERRGNTAGVDRYEGSWVVV